MAISAAVVGAVASVGGEVVSATNQSRAAAASRKAAAATLASQPDPVAQQMKAQQAASLAAGATQRTLAAKGAKDSTILTTPLGVPATPPPASKTLLGG